MDRYTIAIQCRDKALKKKMFRFPSTDDTKKIISYMVYCLINNGVFFAGNLPEKILNKAIIKYSKKYNYAIVVDSDETAARLSISYSYKHVYAYDTTLNKTKNIIYYNCPSKKVPTAQNVIIIKLK